MPHPDGGKGNSFATRNTFNEAYNHIGKDGFEFRSTTNEIIFAHRGFAQDGKSKTIVFRGENNRQGNVCEACWGYRNNCSNTRIGQCIEALDLAF